MSHVTRLLSHHPSIPLKILQPYTLHYHQQRLRRTFITSATTRPNNNIYQNNIAKLYARRTLELLSLAIAAKSLSSPTISSKLGEVAATTPSRPLEWDSLKKQSYDLGSFGDTRLIRLWRAGRRIASLTLLASPLFLLVPMAALSGKESRVEEWAWDYAIWSVEKAGPTFTKFVQWATTRSDLFPAEFCSKFSRLQDNTIGHPWSDTHQILQSSLGPNYHQKMSFPSQTPIGSGCIAQVYRAKLLQPIADYPSGTDVAVKVQHPHILQKVLGDFYLLRKIATFLEHIPLLNLHYLSLRDSVSQFREIMLPQLDLECEARNLRRFRRNFSGDKQISFPDPLMELTTKDVLVETFVHGEPILNFLDNDDDDQQHHTTKDRQDLATIGLRVTMEMIFLHDFVHGDLHPGNILVNRNEENGGKLRLNMIDCGLVVEMGEREHKNLVAILGAFIKKDGALAGRLMVDTARECQATDIDVELFCRGMAKICTDDEDNNFLEKVGDYLAEICYLACRHKVKLEASFINAALACEIMEGIASSLYPDMLVQHIALPMVFKAEMMHGIKGFSFPKIL